MARAWTKKTLACSAVSGPIGRIWILVVRGEFVPLSLFTGLPSAVCSSYLVSRPPVKQRLSLRPSAKKGLLTWSSPLTVMHWCLARHVLLAGKSPCCSLTGYVLTLALTSPTNPGHFDSIEIYTDCVISATTGLQPPGLVLMAILCGGDYDVSVQGIANGCADDMWPRMAFVVVA